ncbi:MAG: hypothetical protein ACR2NO_08105 [Chloroflexota bacterium]
MRRGSVALPRLRERGRLAALFSTVVHRARGQAGWQEMGEPDRRTTRTWQHFVLGVVVARSTRLVSIGQAVLGQRAAQSVKAVAMALGYFLSVAKFPAATVSTQVLEAAVRQLDPSQVATYRGKVVLAVGRQNVAPDMAATAAIFSAAGIERRSILRGSPCARRHRSRTARAYQEGRGFAFPQRVPKGQSMPALLDWRRLQMARRWPEVAARPDRVRGPMKRLARAIAPARRHAAVSQAPSLRRSARPLQTARPRRARPFGRATR